MPPTLRRFAPLAVALWILGLGAALAIDPYTAGILDAQAARSTQQADTVFDDLRVVGTGDLRQLTVDDGAGGTKTIAAINLITLTSYTTPYNGATYLQRYVVDATSTYKANLWTTVEGDLKHYFNDHNLPATDNQTVANSMLEALGMQDATGYQVLSLWVEPRYVTRPSFSPDILGHAAPTWTGTAYTFTGTDAVTADFIGIAPVNTNAEGQYYRPFDSFTGPSKYEDWLNAWSTASYNLNGGRAFPYTGLGWTWNWNTDPGLNGFALSEFLVSAGAEYYFNSLQQPILYIPEPGLLLWLPAGLFLLRRRPHTIHFPGGLILIHTSN